MGNEKDNEQENVDKKYSDYDEQWRDFTGKFIRERWGQLNSMIRDVINKITQFLFLTNSGGAVAILSYMGVNSDARKLLGPRLSLTCFLLGLIIYGFYLAMYYYFNDDLIRKWNADSDKFFRDELGWKQLNDDDEERVNSNKMIIVLPKLAWASFGFFVLGSVIGLYSFLI